ncbi:MAG: hypothetical protein ACRDSP_11835 [Pseudonocardiaceae bacterium]
MRFSPPRLRRPLQVVALGEVLAAILLAVLGWWCWHRGVIVTVQDGAELTRIEGVWWAGATGAVTLAGLLLLDAVRQAVRTVRARPLTPSDRDDLDVAVAWRSP